MWKTKDGREVAFKDMTDQHVINTLEYFRRASANVYPKAISNSWSFGMMLTGEMAQECFEQEITEMEEMGLFGFALMTVPSLAGVVREAIQRGLDVHALEEWQDALLEVG